MLVEFFLPDVFVVIRAAPRYTQAQFSAMCWIDRADASAGIVPFEEFLARIARPVSEWPESTAWDWTFPKEEFERWKRDPMHISITPVTRLNIWLVPPETLFDHLIHGFPLRAPHLECLNEALAWTC